MRWSIAVLARLALCAVFVVSAGSKLASTQARTAYARLFRLQAQAFLGQRNPDDHGALAETP
jgi:hypothetical protein